MRLILTLCLSLCCFIPSVAQTIWNSNTVTFNKVALEDADPITQHVILTRGENKGIYNSASETECTSISPMDTEWAEGTTADWSNLVFESFSNGVGLGNNGFRAPENTPLVLHLMTRQTFTATCPPNRNDVFRIGQRLRPIFLNSGHLIGSGDMCP